MKQVLRAVIGMATAASVLVGCGVSPAVPGAFQPVIPLVSAPAALASPRLPGRTAVDPAVDAVALLAGPAAIPNAVPSTAAEADGPMGPATAGNGKRDWTSTVTGDPPNFTQMSNGTLMTVVSRDFGRGAKAGALVELYYPFYGTDNLWDSYVGITTQGKLQWAHQLKLVSQTLVPDTGIAVTRFAGDGYTLAIEDLVRPQANAHVRHVTVTNTSDQPLVGLKSTFYGFFTLNNFPAGDRLHYDRNAGALVQEGKNVAVAVAADRPTTGWQCGLANLPVSRAKDARVAAEAGTLPGDDSAGPTPLGVNGALAEALPTVAPGASISVTYAIGVGPDGSRALAEAQDALQATWPGVRQDETDSWARWLSAARMPAALPADAQAVYRRALITVKQHAARNGAIIAGSTNINPPYRLVWVRDGSFNALTLAEAGYPAEAKAFFEFLERIQQPGGGWPINYFPDASRALWDFGPNGNEHDQVGTFVWAVERLARETGDGTWLAARWPAARKACEFILAQQQPDGLMSESRDLWELDHGSWTYSNAACWAGLMAGSRLAGQMGAAADVQRYQAAAVRLKAAVEAQLVVNGTFVRGTRKGKLDTVLEAANLALGSTQFAMFPDSDPRMKALGQAIGSRLTSGQGGIFRYEGDPFYGGHPWPVTTDWLALHRQAIGDRKGARRLFDVTTRYAQATASLQLGEEFDEAQNRWTSAMPLVWSASTYIKTALALF